MPLAKKVHVLAAATEQVVGQDRNRSGQDVGIATRALALMLVLSLLAIVALYSLITANTEELRFAMPVYIKLEAEDFDGFDTKIWDWNMAWKPHWDRGGDSGWWAAKGAAKASRGELFLEGFIPQSGDYCAWARYEDYFGEPEPFDVIVSMPGGEARARYGRGDVVAAQSLYGWSFAWERQTLKLRKGAATVRIVLAGAARVRRGVDAIVLTTDAAWKPTHRGFPPQAYATYLVKWAETRRASKPLVASAASDVRIPPAWKLPETLGRDFWITGASQIIPGYSRAVFIRGAKPTAEAFAERYGANPSSAPVFGTPVSAVKLNINLVRRLCDPTDRMRRYILENQLPFVLVGNYNSAGGIKDSFQKIQKVFGDLWLGIVSGENSYLNLQVWPASSSGNGAGFKPSMYSWLLAQGREEWRRKLGQDWSSDVPDPFAKIIFAASVGTLPLVHRLGEAGCPILAFESAAAMPYIQLQAAFVRGAARQYGRRWIWYYGASFGDAIRSFITEPPYFLELEGLRVEERNAVVGPSLAHIRRTLLHAYLQGASFFHPEQGYDLFDTSGSLNPMGWSYDEMTRLAVRHPDRGVIDTPVAILLDHAHGWDKYTYKGMRICQKRPLQRCDRMINELFNVACFPFPKNEGNLVDDLNVPWPHGVFGDIFDVLVTSPAHLDAVRSYKLVICAGDTRLNANSAETLKRYVEAGGALAINVEQARGVFDEAFLGASLGHAWKEAHTVECLRDGERLPGTVFKYLFVDPVSAEVIARAGSDPIALVNQLGKGRVILTTPSYLLGLDGVAMPYLAHLMLELTSGLLPVEVRGDCHYSVNLRKDGIVIMIENNRGIVKRSHQPAIMDGSRASEVELRLDREPKKTEEWLGEQPQSWNFPNEWLLDYTRPIRIDWRKGPAGYYTTVKLAPGEIRLVFVQTK